MSRTASVTELSQFVEAIFIRVGMSAEDAALMTGSLVAADRWGLTTHGTARLRPYVAQLRSGEVNVRPTETVMVDQPSGFLIDADRAFGAPAGIRAMERAMEKAKATGACLAGVRNVAHFGAAGYYTRFAADRGFLALAMSSSSPSVVPFGGYTPRIGNSPMSFATPGQTHPELVMDMAQSMTSRGRIKIAADFEQSIPAGWALDRDGRPTTDARKALSGAVLPSGGHKGSAMSLMVEMLSSGLTGATLSQDIQHSGFTTAAPDSAGTAKQKDVTVGNFYLVIDADIFGDAAGVQCRATRIAEHVRASPAAPGVEQVLAPGDLEHVNGRKADEHGVGLLETTIEDFTALAAEFDVPLPAFSAVEA
jgi:LDH2 family malate/lactate/ureidoglycolate dehydrogenase